MAVEAGEEAGDSRYSPDQVRRNEQANQYYAELSDKVSASPPEPIFKDMPKKDFPLKPAAGEQPTTQTEAESDG